MRVWAALLSLLLPGLGHIVRGRTVRALCWFAAHAVSWLLVFFLPIVGVFAFMGLRLVAAIDALVVEKGDATDRGWKALSMIGAFLAMWVGLRVAVVEAFKIPSGGMIPTLQVGDHIFVDKMHKHPKRGDVIVFQYPKEPDKDFVKRVVAVGGDSIEVRQNVVSVNGEPLPREELDAGPCSYWDYDEHYNQWKEHTCRAFQERNGAHRYHVITATDESSIDFPRPGDPTPYVVPDGTVFVMGDNRNNSSDSRSWGPVPVGNIKGTAWRVWWSSGKPSGTRWDRVGQRIY
jgi:signal peptidase I